MNVVQLNYAYDATLSDPDELLNRYFTLTGWSEALAAAGAEVTVVQRFQSDAERIRNGIVYRFCNRDEHTAVVDARPDVVHINGLIFPLQTWWLRRALPPQSAVVVQDHGSLAPEGVSLQKPQSIRRAVAGRGLRAADGFLFSSLEQAEAWRRAGVIAPHQRTFAVMEGSSTLRPIPRDEARRKSAVTGAPAVLWVGRLNTNKDPLTVLDGFERSLARLPGAVLTMIYGTDELLPAVRERLLASDSLRNRVRLAGRVPRESMSAFYSAADIFVVGSHHEGSGYALLEACACGAVPVVTSIPSFRAITANGFSGALWPPGDAAACADALVSVGHADFGAARSRMAEHFDRALSWTAIGGQALEAYRQVVADRRYSRPRWRRV